LESIVLQDSTCGSPLFSLLPCRGTKRLAAGLSLPAFFLVQRIVRGSMGRFMRWLRQLLTGRKEGRKGLEEKHVASHWGDGPEKEKERWSFVKQRKSGVDGGGRPSGQSTAVTAAEVPSPRVKSFRCCVEEEDVRGRKEKAAVLIQKTFRGYLV
jgi:hypothetical protein